MTVYATAAELREHINKNETNDDLLLTSILAAASKAIDTFCNREQDGFVASASASARLFPGTGGTVQPIDECITVTLVEVKDSPTDATFSAWSSSDWVAFSGDPKLPNFNRTPYDFLMVDPTGDETHFTSGRYSQRQGFPALEDAGVRRTPTVRVTAKWGYAAATPPDVKLATIITASRWYKRGQSAYADAISTPAMGELQYRRALDPDVQMILKLGGLVRPRVG